jgi:hypothetical protein
MGASLPEKNMRKEEPKSPWDWQRAFKKARDPELTHATQTPIGTLPNGTLVPRDSCAVPARLPTISGGQCCSGNLVLFQTRG